MNLLSKILPYNIAQRKWIAVVLTLLLAVPLTIWGIYGIGEYGAALFILTPLLIGIASTIFYGHGRNLTNKEARRISFLTLGVFTVGLMIFAIEGLICIGMAAPPALFLTCAGCLIGQNIVNSKPNSSLTIVLLSVLSIPITAFTEKGSIPDSFTVSTTVTIDADIETVWRNVIEFPMMADPTEFLFRAGISYPIDSEIKGVGVGAVRYCNFNTGSFVEPITEWTEPTLLRFDVREQPEPMTEYSLWDINAPHLHDYFVSEHGQFKLTKLPTGQVELQGTTWYHHNIKPGFYWKLWSDWIIHSIHNRVLSHIKTNAEKAS